MMINKEIIKRNVMHFGADNVIDNAVEESAELIQAIQKFKRDDDILGYNEKRTALLGEIADVYIILANLEEVFKVKDYELQSYIDAKQQRQVERIAKQMRLP